MAAADDAHVAAACANHKWQLRVSTERAEGIPNRITKGIPKGIPEGIPEGIPKGIPKGIPTL